MEASFTRKNRRAELTRIRVVPNLTWAQELLAARSLLRLCVTAHKAFVFQIGHTVVGDVIPAAPNSTHPRFFAQLQAVRSAWAKLASATTQPAKGWYQYLERHAASDPSIGKPTKAWLTHHTITMYQITKNATWAQLAWQGVQQNLINFAASDPTFGGQNNARVIVDIWIDTYDWIYENLTSSQRSQFRTAVNSLIDYIYLEEETCCKFNTYDSWPLRTTDNDVLFHNFFALLKWYIATGDESTYIHDRYLTNSSMNIGGFTSNVTSFPSPPGGKCANGCYKEQQVGWSALLTPNLRTSVAAMCQYYYTGGGSWYPSGYMLGGVHSRVAYDWASLYSALGKDYFPEVGDTMLNFGIKLVKMTTNDAQWMYRWSDDEVGYGGQAELYNTLSVIVATTTWFNITDVRQQYIWWLMSQLLANDPNMQPYDEFFFAFEYTPSLPGESIAAATAAGNFSQGDFGWDMEGLGSYHTGWTASDSTFFFEWEPYDFFDHFTIHVGNFALYRKGQWGPYSPISYGAPTSDGEVTNTMSFYGFPLASQLLQVREYKGMLETVFGSNYAYYLGANCGSINLYNGRFSETTSTFIQEYSRGSLYYHGTNADVILIFDRSNILDPSTLPYWTEDSRSFWSINSNVTMQIENGEFQRRTWQWHCVTEPTLGAEGTISYSPVVPGGDVNSGYTFTASTDQIVTMTTLFTCTEATYANESEITQQQPFDWEAPDNTGWIVYETNEVDAAWDATLHVIAMADVGFSVASAEYTSVPTAAKMVVVTMPSVDNNIVAIYNIQQGASIPSPNCCGSGAAGSCSLGGSPCVDNSTVSTIVPTQHYFYSNVTYFGFGGVSLTTSNVDFFLNDLNTAHSYDLYLDKVLKQTVTPASTTEGFVHIPLTGVATGGNISVCVQVSGAGKCNTTTFPNTVPTNCSAFASPPSPSRSSSPSHSPSASHSHSPTPSRSSSHSRSHSSSTSSSPTHSPSLSSSGSLSPSHSVSHSSSTSSSVSISPSPGNSTPASPSQSGSPSRTGSSSASISPSHSSSQSSSISPSVSRSASQSLSATISPSHSGSHSSSSSPSRAPSPSLSSSNSLSTSSSPLSSPLASPSRSTSASSSGSSSLSSSGSGSPSHSSSQSSSVSISPSHSGSQSSSISSSTTHSPSHSSSLSPSLSGSMSLSITVSPSHSGSHSSSMSISVTRSPSHSSSQSSSGSLSRSPSSSRSSSLSISPSHSSSVSRSPTPSPSVSPSARSPSRSPSSSSVQRGCSANWKRRRGV